MRSKAQLRTALVLTAAMALTASTVGACSDRDSASVATVATAPSEGSGFPSEWSPEAPDWHDCALADAEGFQCATIEVPLDWGDPDGPTIELALGRTPATGDRLGSVITNPGGPGASGLEFLAHAPFSAAVAERFDQVSWDPRGVGDSTAVRCGSGVSEFLHQDPSPDDADEEHDIEEAAAEVSSECAAVDGDLLAHVHTAEVARDLEAIRLALGNEALNYVGFSYGTQIGQEYAEHFGDRIRTMVLDGVVDPSLGFEDFLLGQTAGFEKAFESNDEACAAAGVEACGVADLAAAYDEVAAVVEREPLPAGDIGVGPAELATGATYTGYLNDGWTVLGPALADALDGDGTALLDLALQYFDFGGYGAYAAVVCTDTPHPEDEAAYREFVERAAGVSSRFGPSVANEMLPCATWPVPPQDSPDAVSAPESPTILVVGNTGDPATPLENAVAVAEALEHSRLLVVDADGHTAYGTDQCATDVVDKYLITARAAAEGTRC